MLLPPSLRIRRHPYPIPFPHRPSRCEICQTAGFDYTTLKKCGGCKEVWYHSRECQVNHWPEHKAHCQAVQRRAKEKAKEKAK